MPVLRRRRVLTFLLPEPGPRRVYALAILVGTCGFGLITTAMTLYATRVVHLTAVSTGLGLSIAGLVGLLSAMPMGEVADRHGPRAVVRGALLVQCLAAICYLLVHNFATFVIVSTIDMLALNANMAADGALVRRVGGEEATDFRACTQALANLGISLGVVGCGVAVELGTANAYRALFAGNAIAILATWTILRRLPRYEPLPKPPAGPRWVALADGPFVAYAALGGLMYVQFFVPSLLLPLWIVDHTHAPRWTVALIVLLNTAMVVLFQVRISQGVQTLRDGGRALRKAGVLFLVSCSAMGLAAGLPGWAALLLLAAAVLVHAYGELWHSAGTFALDFGLAPEHAQGQYQGLVGIGNGVGQAAAPVLLVGLCLSLGRIGFIGLGVCFCLLGLAGPALAQWGQRTRPAVYAAGSVEPVVEVS
jgi:MFS family permease